MPETTLAVEHLFTFTGTIGRGASIKSGPMGTRVIVPVLSGAFESVLRSSQRALHDGSHSPRPTRPLNA